MIPVMGAWLREKGDVDRAVEQKLLEPGAEVDGDVDLQFVPWRASQLRQADLAGWRAAKESAAPITRAGSAAVQALPDRALDLLGMGEQSARHRHR